MKPKHLISFVLIAAISTSFSFGQKSKRNKLLHHEFKIIGETFAINRPNIDYRVEIKYLTKPSILFGIGYQFNLKHFGIRSKFLIVKNGFEIQRLAIGIEYHTNITKKMYLAVGTDVGYFKYKYDNYLAEFAEGISIEPFLGGTFYIFRNLSLSSEIKAAYGRMNLDAKFNAHDASGGPYGLGYVWRTSRSYRKIEYSEFFPLISTSINFHF